MTESLGVFAFGRELIKLQDLDPVYNLVYGFDFGSRIKRDRWLLAYWCFYHVGTASWITDHKSYWEGMWEAAQSKDFPRGTERRHFRAGNAIDSIQYLEKIGVSKLFDFFEGEKTLNLKEVSEYVQSWVGFGPWIAFKVADMLERLGVCKVSFSENEVMLYDSPREGALMVWDKYFNQESIESESSKIKTVTEKLLKGLSDLYAPPGKDRPLGIQEIETILCKWKSYMKGHYRLGEDIESIFKGLVKFNQCNTAKLLRTKGEMEGLFG